MDTQRIRVLLDKRDELDAEIRELVTGTKERAQKRCSICQAEGHTARTCPKKET